MANNGGANISIEHLSGENYDTWKMKMEAVLIKHDLWDYVDGTKERPSEVGQVQINWDKKDRKAQADIVLAMASAELKQVKNLKRSLINQKEVQEKPHSLNEWYYQKWKKEKSYGNTLCDCLMLLTSSKRLYSLPASFENFRCGMVSRDNFPTIEALKIKIIEESESRKLKDVDDTNHVMFVKQKQSFGSGNNSSGCGSRDGHCGFAGYGEHSEYVRRGGQSKYGGRSGHSGYVDRGEHRGHVSYGGHSG